MAVFLTAFLVFGCMALYFTFLQEKHKRSKGIPINGSLTVEDIADILKKNMECSFINEIILNDRGNIEFSCKFGHHTAKIEDSELHVDRMVRKFGNYRDTEEAWYLQKYIAVFLDPETAQEDVKCLDKNFLKYIKGLKAMNILKYVVIVLMLLVGLQELRAAEYVKSGGVSHVYFTEYSSSITIGEALSRVCVHGKWDKMKSGEEIHKLQCGKYKWRKAIHLV